MSGFSSLISFSPTFSLFHFLCSLLVSHQYSTFHLLSLTHMLYKVNKWSLFSVSAHYPLCWDPAVRTKLVLLVSSGGRNNHQSIRRLSDQNKCGASSHLIGVADIDRRKGELLQRGHGRLDGRHCRGTRILQIFFSPWAC